MDMGRKLTVLWNEGELGNSVMLSTCFCCRAVLPNVPYRLNAQFGHLVILSVLIPIIILTLRRIPKGY